MLSIDLHSGQCVGYFDIPVDHVYGESVLLDYLASKRIPNGFFLFCSIVCGVMNVL
jgi:ribose-phosphate pyrophosphokinase